MRRRYARQLRLECAVYEMAVDRYSDSHQKVRQIGRTTETNAARRLINAWLPLAEKFVDAEQNKIRRGNHMLDSNIYGPAILLLKPQIMASIGMHIMLNTCLMEPKGPKFIKLALAMGKAIQEEVIKEKEKATKKAKRKDENAKKESEMANAGGRKVKSFVPSRPIEDAFYAEVSKNINQDNVKSRMREYIDDVGAWDKRLQLKVGAAVVDYIQKSCYVPNEFGMVYTPEVCALKGLPAPEPAFIHSYVFERNRRAGVIQIHQKMADTVLATSSGANVLPWTARYLPMLVPPRPWTDVVNGGYLKLRTKIMRQRDSAWQMDCVKRGNMDGILHALNLMSEVPWVINKEVLDVVLKVWEEGDAFGDLPSRKNVPLPDPNSPEFANDPSLYDKNVRKIEQLNREMHSLRCDTLYKLQVAEEFKDEPELYYPYNMDFRGRVYPIPPHLNHLGSDLSRSLLIFRDREPLGERGLHWMKIHLANVFGVDKCSFDERVEFAETHLDKVVASANNPLSDGDCAWWKSADYPFLALGVCFELKRAIESPDPTKYMSNIPIHQDGSCNGLQHYAALGRDLTGGSQVNLVPAPRPSDVYMGVATQVMSKVEHDAALDVPTVEEISARLHETFLTKGHILDEKLENEIYGAACYCAELTMGSMGDLFTSARGIMGWLAKCAAKVGESGQPMSWITPLGLPVVQPYKSKGQAQIRTKVQHVLMRDDEGKPVSIGRQKSAFPPNFVHSLDSTHMMLTAQRCLGEEGIAFAAVHDSYWTHACSVDVMNRRLREEFVHLYEQPLLEDLLLELRVRFPDVRFDDVPELGNLDLRTVLDSPYFFN
ncbi:hypothetical protein JM16_005429 [Phytophthora kernoviae]|uniref:DNA-directed RNA polymerase n=1 Tax=Phytophthora kernoviae TaxID=325452 RepID=A0A8T0LYP3_9STRA|nr:hypothetical protein JM16_005429 [Phytophthora kernoviae]